MKKLLLGVLGLMVFMAFSCKKGERIQRVYLLSQQIIDDRADGLPIDTTKYFYNNQNQLTLVKNGDGHHFTITYDAAGQVDVARTINASGLVVKEFDFFYTPTIGFITKVISKQPDTAYLTFDDRHQLTEIRTLHAGHSAFTYDERGNVASLKNYKPDGSLDLSGENFYTYDHMKSYFSAVPRDNYFLMYILYPDANTGINNVVTKNADVYTYTYNSAGYPVSAKAKVVGRSLTPIYYNYIVK
jgi:YD repeat-containing protein